MLAIEQFALLTKTFVFSVTATLIMATANWLKYIAVIIT